MYLKLLNEAVEERKNGVEEHEEEVVEANITLSIDAFIPNEDASESDKIELYQEILSSSSTESLVVLKRKMKDIYGKMPKSVELLFQKRNIDLLVKESEIVELKEFPKFINIVVGEPYVNIKGIGNLLFEALIPYMKKIKAQYSNHQFIITLNKVQNWINDLEGILATLSNIKSTNKVKVIK